MPPPGTPPPNCTGTELAVTANVKRASAVVGFTPSGLYARRRKDPHFAQAWDAAVADGRARIEAFLVEAADRTFDPASIADDADIPKMTIAETPIRESDFVESDSNRDPWRQGLELFAVKRVARGSQGGRKILLEKYALEELKLIAVVSGIPDARASLPLSRRWTRPLI